ncbi:MAG TPA: hypothetical protein P5295_19265, partial [Spirochaetota bacterium]|nr:hypothetical protein [Spirochaetota bacterium]
MSEIWNKTTQEIAEMFIDFIDKGTSSEMDDRFSIKYYLPFEKISSSTPFQLIIFSQKHGVLAGWRFTKDSFNDKLLHEAFNIIRPALLRQSADEAQLEVAVLFFSDGRLLGGYPFSHESAIIMCSLFPVCDFSPLARP